MFERLQVSVCPMCQAPVLRGEDGVLFDAKPRWALEHPYGEGFSVLSGFEASGGLLRLVRRVQHWPEHECRVQSVPPSGPRPLETGAAGATGVEGSASSGSSSAGARKV